MTAQLALAHLSPTEILHISQSSGGVSRKAKDELVAAFGPLLKKLVVRVCRQYGLPDQDREDVLAETFRLVLTPKIARFKPDRGLPSQYFWGQVRNAAKKVIAQRKCPPAGETEAERAEHRFPHLPPMSPAEHDPECRDAAVFVLLQASPRVRAALELCYWENRPISAIAAQLGISRFALAREIDAFFAEMSERLGGL